MTYDAKFRLNALAKTMDQTLSRWKKVEPTLGQISNAVKGWQQDVENIRFNPDYNNQTTKNALLALDEAWHHRANRYLSLKAANDAHVEIKAAIKSMDTVEPKLTTAQKNTLGYAIKSQQKPDTSAKAIKSWVDEAREQIHEIEMAPHNNRQYMAMNPHYEGLVFGNIAARVKSWFNEQTPAIEAGITQESRNAIKSIHELVDEVGQISAKQYLTRQDKEQIFINVGKAYKMLESVKQAPRTPAIKADLLVDISRVRNAFNGVMPMLESARFDERDLFNEVTGAINEVRRLGNNLPYKSLPEDTMNNIYNADKALSIILTDKRASMRIKALNAAAANIDLIASDVAEASSRNEYEIQSGVTAKDFSQ